MGSAVSEAVSAASDMELVAQIDSGQEITEESLNGADVAVEFSVPGASETNVRALLDAGVHVVVGTTGWTDERLNAIDDTAREAGKGLLIAPNFSVSAVLAMAFAEKAATLFESVEVVELHHPDKVDSPSGTAITTAKRIAKVRSDAGIAPSPDATETDRGARGADIDGVRVHAVRLRGLYAHEEILLGNPGEQLTIRQDSFDRSSFMPGVLLGIRKVIGTKGLTFGLEEFLDLGW